MILKYIIIISWKCI